MLSAPELIRPSAGFWHEAAQTVLRAVRQERLGPLGEPFPSASLSRLHIIVPSSHHVALLKRALTEAIPGPFAAPQILTLQRWLSLQAPDEGSRPAVSDGERMMALYAELRQHAWLKTMFAARRSADLLPLARTLIALCDELTCAMLPLVRQSAGQADLRWLTALEELPAPARKLLSEETELVWSVWKAQLDSNDPLAMRFSAMLKLAEQCSCPLVWIDSVPPNPLEHAFLEAYASRRPVLRIGLDWRQESVDSRCRLAWPELCDPTSVERASSVQGDDRVQGASTAFLVPAVAPARSLEEEAVRGAQTVIDWLVAGRQSVAVVAQDRAVARRIRALLDRAGIQVADEAGWKLSTTRAAASVAAWFDVVAAQGQVVSLLDFLKSPFVLAARADRVAVIMEIELAIRRRKVRSGWHALLQAGASLDAGLELLKTANDLAKVFSGRKTLVAWRAAMHAVLDAFEMRAAMQQDEAGSQVLGVINGAARGVEEATFSFSEWRALLGMQLESTHFVPATLDRRVTLLPLSATRLREFDAVLLVGADAAHLPAQASELLFFADGVRRQLGLKTREERCRQELRDLAALLSSVPETVLSWQAWRNGEPNPVSGWIRRLQLALRACDAPGLAAHAVSLSTATLARTPVEPPAPCAPQRLPARLSASDFARLIACPYQFFTLSMLGLASLDEPDDLPQKRDYGDWVHDILHRFHERIADGTDTGTCREDLLMQITDEVFGRALERHGAALSFYARWKAAAPAYLAWALQREEAGWRYASGETRLERLLQWPGGQVTLHGRIDRIDRHEDGRQAVLDYKTSSVKRLRDRIASGEDCQLAFYGLLAESGFDAAQYVAIDSSKEPVADVEAKEFASLQEELERQITGCFDAIASGTSLAANGIEAVCTFCGVRGLCRKGGWS